MVIKETHIFTRRLLELVDEESYHLLQLHLLRNPESGSVMRGTGGLRKIRWAAKGSGKRGGVRVIYYWHRTQQVILLLLIYEKAHADDLTHPQRAALRRLVDEEFP